MSSKTIRFFISMAIFAYFAYLTITGDPFNFYLRTTDPEVIRQGHIKNIAIVVVLGIPFIIWRYRRLIRNPRWERKYGHIDLNATKETVQATNENKEVPVVKEENKIDPRSGMFKNKRQNALERFIRSN